MRKYIEVSLKNTLSVTGFTSIMEGESFTDYNDKIILNISTDKLYKEFYHRSKTTHAIDDPASPTELVTKVEGDFREISGFIRIYSYNKLKTLQCLEEIKDYFRDGYITLNFNNITFLNSEGDSEDAIPYYEANDIPTETKLGLFHGILGNFTSRHEMYKGKALYNEVTKFNIVFRERAKLNTTDTFSTGLQFITLEEKDE